MTLAYVVVALAAFATLIFNGGYAWSRGHTDVEKASLVLLAVIIDLAKVSFLAAASVLWHRQQRFAASILVLLWCPAIVLSCWASYSYVVTSRATTSAVGTDTNAVRTRAEQSFERAKRKVDLATNHETFSETAGCTRTPSARLKAFCESYRQAEADLKTAEAALTPIRSVAVDPEVTQLARIIGADRTVIELLIALIPALFLELVASLGFYAVNTSRSREAKLKVAERPTEAALAPGPAETGPAPSIPSEPRPEQPVPPQPKTLKAAQPLKPAPTSARSALA